jgi:hypothetical protein
MDMVCLYRGRSVAEAKLIAVSTDSKIVGDLAGRLLQKGTTKSDPAVDALDQGRRKALRIIKAESSQE